ncbi:cysteine dioxygenase [Actinomadura rayongensis]|uniref:Cysteine dioxygenase n=1 Tax=Actinomadura rayongensis TaxID=1429076 RepID=A0A6I4W0J9_9ACTN|nr:cysteine dioxygenase [Actinomadura rayongensis]MXQ62738.1 cysteine dioxygenase [Actinomadura rayongensis]
MVPDLTMRGQDDPHGRLLAPRPATAGQLAARVLDLASRPADWWGRVRFDAAAPVRIPLDERDGVRTWITVRPPGHRSGPHAAQGQQVCVLVAGELTEVFIADDGVTERPLRPSRVRVHGGPGTRAVVNPARAYAVTLHAAAV